MSGISGSRRFIAILAALLLLLAVPLGAPAVADPGQVRVSIILDSPEILANITQRVVIRMVEHGPSCVVRR